MGNIFDAKEEAEFYIEQQKIFAELERLAMEDRTSHDNECETPYEIGYNPLKDKLKFVHYPYSLLVVTSPYRFTTMRGVIKAINTIGEDRLKKYYFRVKE